MKRALLILFIFLSFTSAVLAQTPTKRPTPTMGPRFAACDLCGYCPPNNPPQSWSACQKCLYPDINPDPAAQESLKIDPATNLPVAPASGRQYTFLGCITTGTGSFQEGGVAGVVQTLLRIIFSIVGGVAFLYLIYGAFVIASSQNNTEKLNYGRRLVYGAIIGLVFSLMSVLIVNLIANQVLKIPGFGDGSTL
jgi:hypothetical protein